MRFVVMFTLLALSTAAAGEQILQGINGPAVPAILRFLSTNKMECPSDPDRTCVIGASVMGASTFYGQFAGDPANYAVAFVLIDSGGNEPRMDALMFKAATSDDEFELVGKAGVFGEDPREVRFGAGHTISWVGTVMNPEDAQCCPTGKRTMHLEVSDRGVRFLDK